MYAAGDVRVEEVKDSAVQRPTDALVRITAAAICGSDLWPYASLKPEDGPARVGHEFIGVVEETGPEVTTVKRGDLVVSACGAEGIAAVRDLAGGHGAHVVIVAVGTLPAYRQAVGIARPGGVISRVGVPQYEDAPVGFGSLFGPNIRLAGGPAPVRAYMTELMPDILDGTIEPGKVFDESTDLDGVPAGYQDMADRTAIKVFIQP